MLNWFKKTKTEAIHPYHYSQRVLGIHLYLKDGSQHKAEWDNLESVQEYDEKKAELLAKIEEFKKSLNEAQESEFVNFNGALFRKSEVASIAMVNFSKQNRA